MSAAHKKSPADEMKMAEICLSDAKAILPVCSRVAAREAYLAMLHAAHARIAAAGLEVPTKHKGVSMMIGSLYRESDFKAQARLAEIESWKMASDYGRSAAATSEEAGEAIQKASEFIDRMKADIPNEHLQIGLDPAIMAALAAKGRGF